MSSKKIPTEIPETVYHCHRIDDRGPHPNLFAEIHVQPSVLRKIAADWEASIKGGYIAKRHVLCGETVSVRLSLGLQDGPYIN